MWPLSVRRRKVPPRDYFGNVIEVGDRFFCGNPCQAGTVIKIRVSTIMLETGVNYEGVNQTMNFKSPEKGICLDKIPEDMYSE